MRRPGSLHVLSVLACAWLLALSVALPVSADFLGTDQRPHQANPNLNTGRVGGTSGFMAWSGCCTNGDLYVATGTAGGQSIVGATIGTPLVAQGVAALPIYTNSIAYVNLTGTTAPTNGINLVTANTVAFYTNSSRRLDLDPTGHLIARLGTAPTIASSGCGTGTITVAGNDEAFVVTVGTGGLTAGSNCGPITWATASTTNSPVCVQPSSDTDVVSWKVSYSTTASATAVASGNLTAGSKVSFICRRWL